MPSSQFQRHFYYHTTTGTSSALSPRTCTVYGIDPPAGRWRKRACGVIIIELAVVISSWNDVPNQLLGLSRLSALCVILILYIYREDWKPVLTINSIIYGLQYLFLVSIGRYTAMVEYHAGNFHFY